MSFDNTSTTSQSNMGSSTQGTGIPSAANNPYTTNFSPNMDMNAAAGGQGSSNASQISTPRFSISKKRKLPWKIIFGVLLLIMLIGGGGAGYYLTQMNQDVRQQASQQQGFSYETTNSDRSTWGTIPTGQACIESVQCQSNNCNGTCLPIQCFEKGRFGNCTQITNAIFASPSQCTSTRNRYSSQASCQSATFIKKAIGEGCSENTECESDLCESVGSGPLVNMEDNSAPASSGEKVCKSRTVSDSDNTTPQTFSCWEINTRRNCMAVPNSTERCLGSSNNKYSSEPQCTLARDNNQCTNNNQCLNGTQCVNFTCTSTATSPTCTDYYTGYCLNGKLCTENDVFSSSLATGNTCSATGTGGTQDPNVCCVANGVSRWQTRSSCLASDSTFNASITTQAACTSTSTGGTTTRTCSDTGLNSCLNGKTCTTQNVVGSTQATGADCRTCSDTGENSCLNGRTCTIQNVVGSTQATGATCGTGTGGTTSLGCWRLSGNSCVQNVIPGGTTQLCNKSLGNYPSNTECLAGNGLLADWSICSANSQCQSNNCQTQGSSQVCYPKLHTCFVKSGTATNPVCGQSTSTVPCTNVNGRYSAKSICEAAISTVPHCGRYVEGTCLNGRKCTQEDSIGSRPASGDTCALGAGAPCTATSTCSTGFTCRTESGLPINNSSGEQARCLPTTGTTLVRCGDKNPGQCVNGRTCSSLDISQNGLPTGSACVITSEGGTSTGGTGTGGTQTQCILDNEACGSERGLSDTCCGTAICQGYSGSRRCENPNLTGDQICNSDGNGGTCTGWAGFKCDALHTSPSAPGGQLVCEKNGQSFTDRTDAANYAGQCGQIDKVCVGGSNAGKLCGEFNIINNNCGVPPVPPVTPEPTPPVVLSCDSTCTTNEQCQSVDSRFTCHATGDGTSRCRLATNTASTICQPAVGPMCLSLTKTNVTDASRTTPKLGDAISLTCGEVPLATRYIFRVVQPDGTILDLNGTGRTSEPFVISKSGHYTAQCQICTGAEASTCLPYEPVK